MASIQYNAQKTADTPHLINPGTGKCYVSHADYIEYLYDCAERWERQGERAEANRIRAKILRLKSRGQRRCAVCEFARLQNLPPTQ